ncbi:cation transporter [Bradyrhizobium sp. AS23.2]|uniref:cation transporter n=1 Tax=Bradyrhizobium sp. AS23.2 TaxID=1680155 RepID=UPI0009394FB2|nr:cation transporter [Bradyrhizobium sp. AS23.2]OKO79734.1 mercury transporter [Bradyrhizobium sp. AS23.2]
MNKLLLNSVALAVCLAGSSTAFSAERTVTLAVKNMYCAACPHTVKASLEAVPGVAKVAVSYRDKTATVTFDDAKAGLDALTTATTNAGFRPLPRVSDASRPYAARRRGRR